MEHTGDLVQQMSIDSKNSEKSNESWTVQSKRKSAIAPGSKPLTIGVRGGQVAEDPLF